MSVRSDIRRAPEHDPDPRHPAMLAYLEKRAEYEAERGAPYGEPTP